MNRGTLPPDQPAYINWAETFAYEFMELCNGENDIHSLIDWGYEIFPERGSEDPKEVARGEFPKVYPNAGNEPSGSPAK